MPTSLELHQRMLAGELNPTHGKASTYRNYRCRCDACTAENTRRAQQEQASRARRLEAMFDLLPHGDTSTYSNWHCRCDACTKAWSERMREYKRERKKRDDSGVEPGAWTRR